MQTVTQYIPRLTASEKNDKTPYINVNGSDHLKTLGTYYERGNIRVGARTTRVTTVYIVMVRCFIYSFHLAPREFPPIRKAEGLERSEY